MARNVKQKLGQPKGVPNKVTKAVKDMILGALEDVGGQKYFAEQAIENPSAFMSLVGKIIPNEIKADITTTEMPTIVRIVGAKK